METSLGMAKAGDGTLTVPARVGGVGVYATPASLTGWYRARPERLIRTGLTFLGTLIATPFGFLVPPHLEPAVVVFLIGLYFTRRAWVGEWQAADLSATCPRCDAPVRVRSGAVLYLPHSVTCAACRAELWIELGEPPDVAEEARREAQERARAPRESTGELVRRPPTTWSPASSDWRDRPREPRD
jgi:hypothetical protein